MATKKEKIEALTDLMVSGILTTQEFSRLVVALDEETPNEQMISKENDLLEIEYEEVFKKHVAPIYKPAVCTWPEFKTEMVKKGSFKILNKLTECTYIETYIDRPNAFGAMLRENLRLVVNDGGKITRALHELQTSDGGLVGSIFNASNKDKWTDIVRFK